MLVRATASVGVRVDVEGYQQAAIEVFDYTDLPGGAITVVEVLHVQTANVPVDSPTVTTIIVQR